MALSRFLAIPAILVLAAALPPAAAGVPGVAGGPVLVTGATGRTGALVYGILKENGVAVRAFVRNATKAREVLGCQRCDPSEGIFVGDVTDEASLQPAMKGVGALAVVTSAIPVCKKGPTPGPPDCSYPTGAYPVDVDFHGGRAQIAAFAAAGNPGARVVLCSSMGTTNPESFLEKLGNGHIGFFKLNEEAFLMNSGLPFTIVKPCGLTDGPPAKAQLLVGHDDSIDVKPPLVSRADVARVMVAALRTSEATNLRFDLCSDSTGPVTEDANAVLEAAKYPWQRRSAAQQAVVV